MQASGLAMIWAEENTRTAIFDAMQRKEVYGTTVYISPALFCGQWSELRI